MVFLLLKYYFIQDEWMHFFLLHNGWSDYNCLNDTSWLVCVYLFAFHFSFALAYSIIGL
jgi:hypothetical protein